VKDLFKTSKGKYVAPAPIEDKLVMHERRRGLRVVGANLGQPLAWCMLNAERRIERPPPDGEARSSLAGRAPEEHQRDAGPARAAGLHRAVHQPWTVDNDLITPTFKVKRNDVDKAFGKQYETWAESRQKVILAD
jgi:long-chain acyl-CoA synthetase